jgi:hypothetical protein
MVATDGNPIGERNRQYVPNKRVSTLRLMRWRKMRRSKRRRKSVIAYWWGPILLAILVSAGLLSVAFKLPRRVEKPAQSLPQPSLQVVYVTEAMVNRLQRNENMRRQAMALSDEEVGISLTPLLPEPAKRTRKEVVTAVVSISDSSEKGVSPDTLLPPMRDTEQVHTFETGVKWVADDALTQSQFKVTFSPLSTEDSTDYACFQVQLNDAGHVVEVLRFEPTGSETAWVKHVRESLLMGLGKSAAMGVIRIYRK